MKTPIASFVVTIGAFLGPVSASGFDLSALTQLADDAVAGAGVDQAIPGFEILLLRDGEPIYHRAFGDWAIGEVARADSSTKTLSGALMMALTESVPGFSIDSRLADYLLEYRRPVYDRITIRQAFSHTSGLPGDEASPILARPDITLRQAAFAIAGVPLSSGPPGTLFDYGGLSMQAAGAAAEVAAGQPFLELLDQHLVQPLGLTDTRFVIASDANPRVAGGAESTATDFARLMDMLLNGGVDRATGTRVLSEASVDAMLSLQTTPEQGIVDSPVDNNRYGVGVWIDQLTQASTGVDALAGGARGFHSWIDRDEGLVFAFATDRTRFSNVELLSSQMHAAILAAVPEPSAATLLTLGVAVCRRRG